MMQFGGLAFMPFALILMTEPHSGPGFLGPLAAMGAFLLTGLGMHVAQTAGLAWPPILPLKSHASSSGGTAVFDVADRHD
jgi:hypothetical protein